MPRARNHHLLGKRRMTSAMLIFAVFCCVCGGPIGLEPLVAEAGPGLAITLILLMPLLWALPDALTTCELAPALPVEGGYIVWVRRALGEFAGFLNAWWTWIYAVVDATLYPVLFARYLSALLQLAFGIDLLERSAIANWGVCVVVIVVFAILNIRGARGVGKASVVLTALILLPFAAMVVVGLTRYALDPQPIVLSFTAEGKSISQGLAAGLGIIMWNYLGWDALSTIAEEVEEPQRAYPRALLIGVPLVMLTYLLPTIVGLLFYPETEKWVENAWPAIGGAVGGPVIEWALLAAGLVAPIALFTASLLGTSRVPFVMAEQGFAPAALTALHPVFGTPRRAILLNSVLYIALAWKGFLELVELNVLMYSAALCLESFTLLVLRIKEPHLPRPFKVPGGLPGVTLVIALPISMVALMVTLSIIEEGWQGQITSAIALASGPVAYLLIRKFQPFGPIGGDPSGETVP